MKLFIFSLWLNALLGLTSSHAQNTPNIDTNTETSTEVNESFSFPGGITEVLIKKKGPLLPEIKYGIQQPTIIEQNDHWRILVGLSLDTIPGEYLIYLKHDLDDATSENIKFTVKQKDQTIVLSNTKLNSEIERTHKNVNKLGYENSRQPNLPLLFPAKGNWNLDFGSIHYNPKNKKSKIQNQLLLKTKNVISVLSPENALVSNIINNQNGTSTIFLDHGRGLYSVMSGITDLSVEIGNGVLSGAVIGKVTPKTDFKKTPVAATTLTWQCILNGIYVNPATLTKL